MPIVLSVVDAIFVSDKMLVGDHHLTSLPKIHPIDVFGKKSKGSCITC